MLDSNFIANDQQSQEEVLFDGGGTADCYRLIQDNRIYCVKRPKPQFCDSEAYMSLFQKEYELGAQLEHPHIVRYYNYDTDEHGPYIKMEYVDGDNLEEFIAQHPDYLEDKRNRKRFLNELLSALEYLHGKKMLHLDLKPRNILITRKYKEVKLIDLGFGWSEIFLYDLGYTRDYCAPEQLEAKTDQFLPSTDIYALGKILQHFHMAKDSVVQQCLKEDPNERFQSIAELRRAIRQSENKSKAKKALLVLVAVVLLGGMLWFLLGNHSDPVPPSAPEGAINGLFTINEAGDQVYFSKGNLQYQASTNTWRFADHQWNYVGEGNSNISPTYDGWIDLYSWGTSGYHDSIDPNNVYYHPWDIVDTVNGVHIIIDRDFNPSGIGPSSNMASIDLTGSSANYDWGVFNPIENGGNEKGLWRTMTTEEWNYVLEKRNTISGIRYVKAKLGPVNGLILLPDNWDEQLYTPNGANLETTKHDDNVIDFPQWDTLQDAGAVFLPASGSRWLNYTWALNWVGAYWTASAAGDTSAYRVYFDNTIIRNTPAAGRPDGHAVRLVRDK